MLTPLIIVLLLVASTFNYFLALYYGLWPMAILAAVTTLGAWVAYETNLE